MADGGGPSLTETERRARELLGFVPPPHALVLDVPWLIRGKDRHRYNRFQQRHHPDAKAKAAEKTLGQAAMAARRGPWLLTGAIAMHAAVLMPVPESWPKRKKAEALAGLVRPTVKPDYDNVAKLIGDALNEVIWQDDSQIADGRVVRWYSADAPRSIIWIWQLP